MNAPQFDELSKVVYVHDFQFFEILSWFLIIMGGDQDFMLTLYVSLMD